MDREDLLGGASSGTFGAGTALGLGSSIIGYKGTEKTNEANERIASARNLMEVEEAKKARDFSQTEALTNRAFQSGQATINRQYQERLSNSAVQRRMDDMKKAGINPILAGKYDASSPAGQAVSGSQGPTAKANAHGYEEKNKIQSALDNLGLALSIKKLGAEAKIADNTAKITSPKASLMDDVNNLYQGAKNIATESSELINTSAKSVTNTINNAVDESMKQIHNLTTNPLRAPNKPGVYGRTKDTRWIKAGEK